jgi:hypothetical protein
VLAWAGCLGLESGQRYGPALGHKPFQLWTTAGLLLLGDLVIRLGFVPRGQISLSFISEFVLIIQINSGLFQNSYKFKFKTENYEINFVG